MRDTNMTTPNSSMMSVRELSAFLNVKEKTLYQWAELRRIPYFKLNGCLRFDLDEIKEWMKTCKTEVKSGKTRGETLLKDKSLKTEE